jgi:hypothetical protein
MKTKKLLIPKIIIILLIIFILFITQNKNKSLLDTYYDNPIVSIILISNNKISVNAGLYRYGDINLDSKINNDDVSTINQIINNKLTISDLQKSLIDLNQDNTINDLDINLLNNYLKNKDIHYDNKQSSLKYCISLTDSASNCTWQDSNEFTLNEETQYYIFVKYNNKISESYKYNYEIIEEKPLINDSIETELDKYNID